MHRFASSSTSVLLLLLSVVILFGCSDDDVADPENQPPAILSLVAEPDTFVADHIAVITVTAEDDDGDKLQYSWDMHGSWLLPLPSEGNVAEVTNCCEIDEMRTGMVVSRVSDGRGGEARDSVQIWVLPGGQP
jgi:hypothetical protein